MRSIGLAIYSVSKHLTPKELLPFGPALTQQAHDVAAPYGLNFPTVHIVESKAAVPSGYGWIVVGDNIDEPDALAYHTKDIDGTVSGVCDAAKILDLGGTIARGALSVISAIGHEIAEATIDPACNRYAQAPNGDVWCLEVCDPVQGFVYKSRDGAADLASFVLPNFFDLVMAEAFAEGKIDAATLGPLDHTRQLEAPFTLGAGGYAVLLRRGRPIQIGADTPKHKRGLPSRRLRRLTALARPFGLDVDADLRHVPHKAFSFGNPVTLAVDIIEALTAIATAVESLGEADRKTAMEAIDSGLSKFLTPETPAGSGI